MARTNHKRGASQTGNVENLKTEARQQFADAFFSGEDADGNWLGACDATMVLHHSMSDNERRNWYLQEGVNPDDPRLTSEYRPTFEALIPPDLRRKFASKATQWAQGFRGAVEGGGIDPTQRGALIDFAGWPGGKGQKTGLSKLRVLYKSLPDIAAAEMQRKVEALEKDFEKGRENWEAMTDQQLATLAEPLVRELVERHMFQWFPDDKADADECRAVDLVFQDEDYAVFFLQAKTG
jgi:hypothetical protein